MNGVGYVVAAYVGAAILYGAYALRLRVREHALVRRADERAR